MLTKAVIDHLRQKVGIGNVYHEREDLLVYGYDATPETRGLPDVAVFPVNVEGTQGRTGRLSRRGSLRHPPRRSHGNLRRERARRRRHGARPHPDESHHRDRRGEPDRHRRSGGHHRRPVQRRCQPGALLPARPRFPERLHARRQHRGKRGRSEGAQVRRHRNYVMALSGLLYDGTEFPPGESASRTWPAIRSATSSWAAKGPSGSSPRRLSA